MVFVAGEDGTQHHRFTSLFDLWITGVGAVIAGDFFGWTLVVESGLGMGFVLVGSVGVLYAGLAMSIAELAVVPNAKGVAAHQFVVPYLGQTAGVVCAIGETLKCVCSTAAAVASIAAYLAESLALPEWTQEVIWAFVVVGIGVVAARGEVSHGFQVTATALSLLILGIFYASAAATGSLGAPKLNTFSHHKVTEAVPFALWFYVGVEGLPLAAPETSAPTALLPRAIVGVVVTVGLAAVLTLLASSSLANQQTLLRVNSHPLLATFRKAWGEHNPATATMAFLVVAGLVASLNAFLFYTKELLSQLAADFFPNARATRPLTTAAAAILAALYLLAFALDNDVADVSDAILWIAICGATVAYAAQLVAFLAMRHQHRYLDMFHWRSPFGATGAVVAVLLDLVVFLCLVLSAVERPKYQPGAIASLLFFAIGLALFARRSQAPSNDDDDDDDDDVVSPFPFQLEEEDKY
ncbi:hypothetical protein CTAYLR_008393 [Chrysophaeum taylorii]|uniref:Uncharacterized protein n=1 Tax=Chrysophaeum taylorii TaxID=2483200 RepID=A0AAD7UJJ4_9STRA|nr:hypothetical protein CTAYLR_008393 [Chrysophaeum taylorii]